jgi:5-aminolevulinate synthase
MDYNQIFSNFINEIKSEGRYRSFLDLGRCAGKFPIAFDYSRNKSIILWCINDYLGMGQHPKVLQAFIETAETMGVGAGGTRNIGGNNHPIVLLEEELADLHNKESGLVFTSGYVANEATLSALAKILPNCIFFSDEGNHASIIAGVRHSKAEKHIFKHNNSEHLRSLISQVDINRPKVIIFESAYSMDGLSSPMEEFCDIADEFNALTYIDEVHTVGLYGKRGAGLAQKAGVDERIDIIQGTLGKAFGVMGGYITGKRNIIDAIRSTASGFIFTTALPPAIAEAARVSVQHLKSQDSERLEHAKKVRLTKQLLKQRKINIIENDTHIIPILINDPIRAKQASEMLLKDFNIYLQHINYPTVPKGTERLRITPTPMHTEQMIVEFVDALKIVLSRLKVEEAAA